VGATTYSNITILKLGKHLAELYYGSKQFKVDQPQKLETDNVKCKIEQFLPDRAIPSSTSVYCLERKTSFTITLEKNNNDTKTPRDYDVVIKTVPVTTAEEIKEYYRFKPT
jgi:hypothetical protein